MTTDPLNAFITIAPDPEPGGRTRAETSAGPLASVRVGIKDLIATAGMRTTAGSRILAEWIPRRHAPIVEALLAAGAVNAGKTNTHEFAFGTTNDNPHYGATRNPWNPELTTGGSSGGSAAAVAAGMVPLALGTDTAGSVRIPAALCGCVGFKPGFGMLPVRGIVPLAPTLDTVGLLAESVTLAGRAFAILTGQRPAAAPADLTGFTIGVAEPQVFGGSDAGVVAAVETALRLLERCGARIRRLAAPIMDRVVAIGVPIVRAEAAHGHRRWFPARRAEYGADVAAALDAGNQLPAKEYIAACRGRRRLARALRALLREVDLLAGPAVPIPAFANARAWEPVLPGGELPRHALTRLTYPFSLSRLPAISVPCGMADGLPVGLQLAGLKEEQVLSAALVFEAARGPWPRPPVWLGNPNV